jgi:hypothetical protein
MDTFLQVFKLNNYCLCANSFQVLLLSFFIGYEYGKMFSNPVKSVSLDLEDIDGKMPITLTTPSKRRVYILVTEVILQMKCATAYRFFLSNSKVT